jgi:ATP phosphoribosyltransferase
MKKMPKGIPNQQLKAERELRAAIGTRRVLLAVDDAWQIEEALAFKVGGPNSAYLVTTRFPQIASQFAGEGAVMVRELSGDQSFTLLKRQISCDLELL